jgi:hypothetical protein
MVPSPRSLLTDSEIQQFQSLVAEHAGTSLTTEQADALAQQLLRILFVIRETTIRSSTDSTSSVDQPALPESQNRAENTYSPA